MKLNLFFTAIVIAFLCAFVCTSAHAWGVAGLQYMAQPQVQQQPPQPTYSQQYNAGYMAGYLNRNGYAAQGTQQVDSAYVEGYRAAEQQ
jgi:hypothetical protein